MPVKNQPDFEALDDIGFIRSSHLTPEESRELAVFFRNLKREQAAEEIAAGAAPSGSNVANLSVAEPTEKQPLLTALSH